MPYSAFISYSHAADGKLAPMLQAALERFAKPWNQLRAMRVFVDKASLSANPGLWSTIESALNDSGYFLLLASPSSARSHWVQKEVQHWTHLGRARQLLVVLTEGDIVWSESDGDFDWSRSTALPDAIRRTLPEEPLYVDLRWIRTETDLSLQDPRFTDAVASLASRVRGIPKDDLYGEHVRQHRKALRVRRILTTALAVVAIAAVTAFVVAVLQRNEAIRQAHMALGRQLAAESAAARIQGAQLLPYSLLLGAESMRMFPSVEADQAIRDALSSIPRQLTVMQHEGGVTGLAVQPTGGRIATATEGGVVRLWTADGSAERRLREGRGRVSAMAFSPDGNRLAAVGDDGRLDVWDVNAGTLSASSSTLKGRTLQIVFSADGQQLAASTILGGGGAVTVVNAATGAVINALPLQSATEFSQGLSFGDGVLAAVAYSRIRVWDTPSWQERPGPEIPPSQFRDIRFLPDGRHLVAASGTGKIWISDVASAQPPRALDCPILTAIAVSPDGRYVAGASRSQQVKIWRTQDWTMVTSLPQTDVGSLAFSASGDAIAVGGLSGIATIWTIPSGEQLASLDHGGAVVGIAFTPDGRGVVTGSADHSARIWQPAAGAGVARIPAGGDTRTAFARRERAFVELTSDAVWTWFFAESRLATIPHDNPRSAVALSGDGQFVAVAGPGDIVRVRDVLVNREIAVLSHSGEIDWEEYERRVREVGISYRDFRGTTTQRQVAARQGTVGLPAFSADGRYLATTRHDFLTRIWDVTERRIVASEPYRFELTSADFSPNGRFVVVVKDWKSLVVLELPSGRKVLSAEASHWLGAVHISDAGAVMAIVEEGGDGARKRVVRLWRSADWQALPSIDMSGDDDSIVLSPSGEFIGVDVRSATVRLFRVQSGAEVARLQGSAPFNALVFSADSRIVAAASSDHAVQLRDVSAGRELSRVVNNEEIAQIALSPDGGSLAIAGPTYGRVFSVSDGREFARVALNGVVSAMLFSPDGAYLATTGHTSTDLWAWRPADILEEACRRLRRGLTDGQWPAVTGVSFETRIGRACGAALK